MAIFKHAVSNYATRAKRPDRNASRFIVEKHVTETADPWPPKFSSRYRKAAAVFRARRETGTDGIRLRESVLRFFFSFPGRTGGGHLRSGVAFSWVGFGRFGFFCVFWVLMCLCIAYMFMYNFMFVYISVALLIWIFLCLSISLYISLRTSHISLNFLVYLRLSYLFITWSLFLFSLLIPWSLSSLLMTISLFSPHIMASLYLLSLCLDIPWTLSPLLTTWPLSVFFYLGLFLFSISYLGLPLPSSCHGLSVVSPHILISLYLFSHPHTLIS